MVGWIHLVPLFMDKMADNKYSSPMRVVVAIGPEATARLDCPDSVALVPDLLGGLQLPHIGQTLNQPSELHLACRIA